MRSCYLSKSLHTLSRAALRRWYHCAPPVQVVERTINLSFSSICLPWYGQQPWHTGDLISWYVRFPSPASLLRFCYAPSFAALFVPEEVKILDSQFISIWGDTKQALSIWNSVLHIIELGLVTITTRIQHIFQLRLWALEVFVYQVHCSNNLLM